MAVYTIRFGGTYYIPGQEVAEEETAEKRGRTKAKAAETDRAGTRAEEGERWRKKEGEKDRPLLSRAPACLLRDISHGGCRHCWDNHNLERGTKHRPRIA